MQAQGQVTISATFINAPEWFPTCNKCESLPTTNTRETFLSLGTWCVLGIQIFGHLFREKQHVLVHLTPSGSSRVSAASALPPANCTWNQKLISFLNRKLQAKKLQYSSIPIWFSSQSLLSASKFPVGPRVWPCPISKNWYQKLF